MFVAGELFGFNEKFPVLVVDYADKERAEREAKEKQDTENYHKIEKALNRSVAYQYSSMQDFIDQLQFELNHVFFDPYISEDTEFDLQIEDNTLHLICKGHDIDFPLDMVRIEASDDTWLDDIDEEDLRTVSGE